MTSFEQIFQPSLIYDDNEFFTQYYQDDLADLPSLNYFQLKYQPNLREFQLIEQIALADAEDMGQRFIRFMWPEETGFTQPVFSYLADQAYGVGKIDLYELDVAHTSIQSRPNGKIIQIGESELDQYLSFNYQLNKSYEDYEANFAGQILQKEKQMFAKENISFYGIMVQDKLVGGLNLIETEDTLEIDSLGIAPLYRRQGLATSLILYVASLGQKKAKNIILVTDSDEQVNAMYEKLGFQYQASKVHILKEL